MSPVNIVKQAVSAGLDMIAVTDHNHTGHCRVTREIGQEYDLWVVFGAEVNTGEDVHCLVYFDDEEQLACFQEYIDEHLPLIPNDEHLFGEQLIVDREEVILEQIKNSLYPGLSAGISEVCAYVHSLGGLFVPAHVDRRSNGLYAQLGFFPENFRPDAVEIFRRTSQEDMRVKYPELESYQLLKNSDAHFINDVGRCSSRYKMKDRNFEEFRKALRGEGGRGIMDD